jgi:hypothetical protein
MIHLTLNTGHSVRHKPGDISPEAIAACRPLVKAGGGPIPGVAPWQVRIAHGPGGAVWSIGRGTQPDAVFCGLASTTAGAAWVWPALERVHHDTGDAMARAGVLADSLANSPEMPGDLPWLGVVILPGLATSAQSDVSWLGDFERCLAFTILDSQK